MITTTSGTSKVLVIGKALPVGGCAQVSNSQSCVVSKHTRNERGDASKNEEEGRVRWKARNMEDYSIANVCTNNAYGSGVRQQRGSR